MSWIIFAYWRIFAFGYEFTSCTPYRVNLHFLVACLLVSSPFFILILLLYFCLFIDRVNKPIIFVFGAFDYWCTNDSVELDTYLLT